MTSNIKLEDASGNVVYIGTRQVEESWVKKINIIEVPGIDDSDMKPLIIDLLAGKRTFTIKGEIGAGGDGASSEVRTPQKNREPNYGT